MSYDNTNRLAQVALPGGAKFRCRYDTFGRRVAIDSFSGEAPTGATLFFYDGQQIILEISNTTTYTYIYGIGIDEPLARYEGSTPIYYHANSLGSIVALTDDSGALIETVEYDVYGLPTVTVQPGKTATGNRYLFTGREWDSETGLYHYRARAYSPSLGRFLQRDPVESVNLYTYVENCPVNFVDPYGLQRGATPSHTGSLKKVVDCLKDSLKELANWGKGFAHRTRTYLDAMKQGKADKRHYDEIMSRCRELRNNIDRIEEICCDDPGTKKLIEEILTLASGICDTVPPPPQKAPELAPAPAPVPAPSPSYFTRAYRWLARNVGRPVCRKVEETGEWVCEHREEAVAYTVIVVGVGMGVVAIVVSGNPVPLQQALERVK